MRSILNPTRFHSAGNTKVYIDIPEKDDPGRRQRVHQDWQLRIWKEVQEYNKSGGIVLFFTCTYDEVHLPRFNYTDGDTTVSLPCFERDHYVKFMNDFRGYFYRNYGVTGPGSTKFNKKGLPVVHAERPVRVMWPCEYGLDKNFSERSHYHPLLFIPKEYLLCPEFKTESSIKKFIQSIWPYGFVIYSRHDVGGIYVTSDFVPVYVSKYCFKETNYYTREDVKNFLFTPDGKRIESHFKAMKGKLPTHWQSLFFGASLVEDFSTYESYRDGVNFGFENVTKEGRQLRSRMPQYIERKIMYDTDSVDHSYHLNDIGVNWRFRKFEEKMDENIQNQRYIYFENLEKLVDSVDINRMFGHLGLMSHEAVRQHVTKLFNGRSLRELYLYNAVWKGLHAISISDVVALDDMTLPQFLSESYIQYYKSLRPPKIDLINPDGVYKSIRRRDKTLSSVYTYDLCTRFEGFVEINFIFEKLYMCYRKKCDDRYHDDLIKRKQLKLQVS